MRHAISTTGCGQRPTAATTGWLGRRVTDLPRSKIGTILRALDAAASHGRLQHPPRKTGLVHACVAAQQQRDKSGLTTTPARDASGTITSREAEMATRCNDEQTSEHAEADACVNNSDRADDKETISLRVASAVHGTGAKIPEALNVGTLVTPVTSAHVASGEDCYRRLVQTAHRLSCYRVATKDVWECMCRILQPSSAVREDIIRGVKDAWPQCKCTKLQQLATKPYAKCALALLTARGMLAYVLEALREAEEVIRGSGGKWRPALSLRRTLGNGRVVGTCSLEGARQHQAADESPARSTFIQGAQPCTALSNGDRTVVVDKSCRTHCASRRISYGTIVL
jgi:hypothetical protein